MAILTFGVTFGQLGLDELAKLLAGCLLETFEHFQTAGVKYT